MTATGALVGMLLGVGLVLVAAGVPWWRRARLDSRLAPYLDRGAAKAARAAAAAAPVTPFPTLERLLRPTLVELAANLDRRLGGRDATARRLVAAGRPADVDAFRLAQVVSGAVGVVVSTGVLLLAVLRGRAVPVPLAVVALLLGAAAGVLWRDQALDRAVRARAARMTAEFPAIAELLAFSVAAGEGTSGALERVSAVAHGDLGDELARALAASRTGVSLVDALADVAERTGLAVVRRFVDGVVIALERGTPLAEVLRAQAADARDAAGRELLEGAGRREIAMLVPVVFLVLPAVVVIALFPGFAGVVVAVP